MPKVGIETKALPIDAKEAAAVARAASVPLIAIAEGGPLGPATSGPTYLNVEKAYSAQFDSDKLEVSITAIAPPYEAYKGPPPAVSTTPVATSIGKVRNFDLTYSEDVARVRFEAFGVAYFMLLNCKGDRVVDVAQCASEDEVKALLDRLVVLKK